MPLDLCEICERPFAKTYSEAMPAATSDRCGRRLTVGEVGQEGVAALGGICYSLGYERLARRGQASGWKAGAEAMRGAAIVAARKAFGDVTRDDYIMNGPRAYMLALKEAIGSMPLPEEPQSQAPASPSADELAGALAHAVLAWNLDPEGRIDGGIIAHARALLARRRAP